MITIGYTIAMTTLTTILVVSLIAELALAIFCPIKKEQSVSYGYTPLYA